MERTRALATASEGSAAEAATATLAKGNAVDAVVAAIFAAAATSPSVLLGPVQILFGGAGLGLRAVDGRTRQAGKGAPRPRGFTAEQEIAPAARVGVPTLPAALAAAVASSGQLTLAQVMAPAIAMAEGPRRDLLRKIAQRGPSMLAAEAIAGELIAVCGRIAGGLLTRDDLDAILPAILPVHEAALEGPARQAAFIPWRQAALSGTRSEAPLPGGHTHVVAAFDHRGLVAVACYERPEEGVTVEPLGLVAPFTASPVLRGETRVGPGTPAAAAAPLALVRTTTESAIDAALAIAGDPDAERVLGEMLDVWSRDADQPAPAYDRQGTLLGVMRTKNAVSLLARRA
jgi:gamma-glutamyltranspeptidase/glutathione hydrolase